MIGWTEEGLEYYNDCVAQIVDERKSQSAALACFEENCMRAWKEELDEWDDKRKKGKKRLGPNFSEKAKRYLVLDELCKEFGIVV